MDRDFKGLQFDSPRSLSVVNVALPIHISDEDADAQPTMFALSTWRLPRVPCIGEEIMVDAIPIRGTVEKVWWDSAGRAVLTLQPVHSTSVRLRRWNATVGVLRPGKTSRRATG